MKKYTVRTSCEVAGVWREAGALVELTDSQARELAPPFGKVVAPYVAADPVAADVTNRAVITGADNGGIERTKRSDGKAAK